MGTHRGLDLTPGQARDPDGTDVLLKATPAGAVPMDKAYAAQTRVVDSLLEAGKAIAIPPRSARKKSHP